MLCAKYVFSMKSEYNHCCLYPYTGNMDNVLSSVVNTTFVTYKQVRKGSKGKFWCWRLCLLLLTNEPLEFSCCANKNTNTLIINGLVSESRVDDSEKIRGNSHRYDFQGLRLCTKAFFHLCTYLNIYQGNRGEKCQHLSTFGRRLTECMTF